MAFPSLGAQDRRTAPLKRSPGHAGADAVARPLEERHKRQQTKGLSPAPAFTSTFAAHEQSPGRNAP